MSIAPAPDVVAAIRSAHQYGELAAVLRTAPEAPLPEVADMLQKFAERGPSYAQAADAIADEIMQKRLLSDRERAHLHSSDFAGPDRSFPIEDRAHAEAALMDSRGKSAAFRASLKRKIARKFPGMAVSGVRKSAGDVTRQVRALLGVSDAS